LQISETVLFLSAYSACAICAFFWVSAFGLPPLRPRARAASKPACVLSRGGGVDRFGDALEADMPVVKAGDSLDKVIEGPA
jgi:hypothetical protein